MKKFLKTVVIIIGAVVILAAVAAIVAASLGYVYAGIKQPSSTVSLHTSICEKSDIEKYNKLLVVFPANEAQQNKKIADFKALGSDVKGKADYLKDPNCVFMAYGVAVQERNQADARTHYEALVALSEDEVYPSTDILDVVSLQSMKDRVESLKNPEEIQKSPMGSG